ncbi:regulatory LuxR family protein [Tenacibaculum adriaticum]|uniref:Regulatory LuxR family protein n=1 Tax=Tenacibaculum adriaticum TaxID=413713 RepID=A0A5S5DWK4_9FLAO|nr:helix-turn-helix transcriptional regulator [Tenacibaculum adriaticum]TYQ00206.1 regulatory LuxR family protein [Tenacibaculum adriaticum]
MFGTSIHWTTFFYLLIDIFIVIFSFFQSFRFKNSNPDRYIVLGVLFIAYNTSGGFLPTKEFFGPLILQYIITYSISIILIIYVIYYLYKEYDILILKIYLSVTNISIILFTGFICLFLLPYFLTKSLYVARIVFTFPAILLSLYFLWAFYDRVSKTPKSNKFTLRRSKLSLLCAFSIASLPLLTVIGDFQWLTFSVMNLSFYAITAIEIDRYLYILENKNKMFEIFSFHKENKQKHIESKLIYQRLTRREIEIAVSILGNKTYKQIGDDFFIAESTVSKHASNIFKKTGARNKTEFIKRFKIKSK